MVLELKDENFENEVLNSKIPVIIDFWAEWCGPCRMMGPVFEEISKDYDKKLNFIKANVDTCQKTAVTYEIMSIPCLVMFKDGKEHKRFVGFKQKEKLKEEINAALNN